METFMQLLRTGTVSPDEIDTYLLAWHTRASDSPLSAYLGMTPEEYGDWVNRPNLRDWLKAVNTLAT